jgi:curved DNA-binding protein
MTYFDTAYSEHQGADGPLTQAAARRLLGLGAGANGDAIARAFRAAVKAAHPDHAGGDSDRLRRVIEAHRVLTGEAQEESAPTPLKLTLKINLHEALFGGLRRVETREGRRLDVKVPPGLASGDVLRLSDADEGSDVLLQVAIAAERGSSLQGVDLWLDMEADADALEKGARLEVETPRGRKAFTAPRTSKDGMVMVRFRGQGLPARAGRPAGDMIIRLSPRKRAAGRSPLLRWFSDRRAA